MRARFLAAPLSVVEGGDVELPESCRIGDHVDFNDLPVSDREPQCPRQPPLRCEDDADGSVHNRRLSESHRAREGERTLRLCPRTA